MLEQAKEDEIQQNFGNLQNEDEDEESVHSKKENQGRTDQSQPDHGDNSESESDHDTSEDEHHHHDETQDPVYSEEHLSIKDSEFKKIRKLKIAEREKQKIEQNTKKDVLVIE